MKNDDQRRTGRTSRMLAEAKALARQGRAVYVLAATPADAKRLERMAGADGAGLGIRYESIDGLDNLDLEQMRLTGAHPNTVVLIDHHAIEMRFSAVLQMLRRYDTAS